MPVFPSLSFGIPHGAWVLLALGISILTAWATYSVPQYVAIERGWPRVYYAAPYAAVVVGVVMYAVSAKLTLLTFVLGSIVIALWIDGKLAGPGYERGRELYEQYGDDWPDHWEPSEVPV